MVYDRRFSTFHIARPTGIFPGLNESFVECDGDVVPETVRKFCLLLKNLGIFQAGLFIRVRFDHSSGLCQLLGHRQMVPQDFSTKCEEFEVYSFWVCPPAPVKEYTVGTPRRFESLRGSSLR